MKTPIRTFTLSVVAALVGFASYADDFSVERSYSLYLPEFIAKDDACVSAFTTTIAPQFRGLSRVDLSASNIVETTSGFLATYIDVQFRSAFGDAVGSINCVFAANSNGVTDVSVTFSGSGLGGFEKRGLSSPSEDPADWKATSVSAQLRP